MDRNSLRRYFNFILLGQARKSLWIETRHLNVFSQLSIGQARKSLWIETPGMSPPCTTVRKGQARKSLWIETWRCLAYSHTEKVRLVRACGSKPVKVMDWEQDERVRLVRACGSKLFWQSDFPLPCSVRLVRACGSKPGYHGGTDVFEQGQARKSLWIETVKCFIGISHQQVRLVRACGSKLPLAE